MSITNSKFDSNSIGPQGCGGLALHYKIYLDMDYEAHRMHKFRVNLNVSGCIFSHHPPNLTTQKLSSESSVILAKSAPYFAIHNTTLAFNMCTSILALGSTLVFSGSSRISGNTALSGGAICLCSKAILYFTPHTDLVITNNTAMQTGGGIMVDASCSLDIPMCFYQYSCPSLLGNIHIHINNNSAPMGGDNIYGGSVEYCYFLYVQNDRKDWQYRNLQVPK